MPDNAMNDIDWAYLAGLIDGEGHLGIQVQRSFGIILVITNSSVAIMDWLEDRMPAGGKYQVTPSPKSKRTMWQWWVYNEGIWPIISGVMPYLVGKREEAGVILLALEERKKYSYALGTGHCLPQSFRKRMEELSNMLLSMRLPGRGISVDVSDILSSSDMPIPLFTM